MDKSESISETRITLKVLWLVFIILRLFNIISLSWWWILSPIWVPLGLGALIIVVCYVATLFGSEEY